MAIEGVDAFPLCWPDGWARSEGQRASKYKSIGVDIVRKDVLTELRRMSVSRRDIVLSTNLPLRKDGEPYGDARCQGSTGVAVYWMRGGRPQVIACDKWLKVGENLRAVQHALEALRVLERCGSSQILERAFMGFAALPAANRAKPWRELLGISEESLRGLGPNGKRQVVEESFRELALIHHPDRGGAHERMAEINRARDEALNELACTPR